MTLTSNLARVLLASALAAAAPASSAAAIRGPYAAQIAYRRRSDDDGELHPDRRAAAGPPPARCSSSGRAGSDSNMASGDLLLVANGKTLTFIDYQVGQKSSWPLGRTPLGVLLSDSPDFNGKAEILPSDNARVVVARARNTGQYGQLTLAFLRSPSAPGGLQLYGWTAIDPQNQPHDGPAVQRAVQCCRPGKRVHLRRTRRSDRMKKVSVCDAFIAMTGRVVLNRLSIPRLALGFPPVTRGVRDPLRDERLVGPRSKPPERGPFSYRRGKGKRASWLHG